MQLSSMIFIAGAFIGAASAAPSPNELPSVFESRSGMKRQASSSSIAERDDPPNSCFCDNNPRCINNYNKSYMVETNGKFYFVCYNEAGSGDTHPWDQGFVDDTASMLKTMVDGGVCCVDCSTAEKEGNKCSGHNGLGNADSCGINGSGKGPGFEQEQVDGWVNVLKDGVSQGIEWDDLFPPRLVYNDGTNYLPMADVSVLYGDSC